MFKILAIVGTDLSKGFKFSGVDVKTAESSEVAKRVLLETLETKDYGIIIINEGYMNDFDEPTKRLVSKSNVPLVVPMPLEMKWKESDKKKVDTSVQEMIRGILAYQIKIS